MYYVGLCPICSDGLRGVRVCCGTPVVLCDECDALWSSPSADDRVSSRADPPCGQCRTSLWGDQAHWATRAEIEQAGWWEQVEGEAGERSSSGGPRVPDEISRLLGEPTGTGDSTSDQSSASSDHQGSGHLVLILGFLVAGCAVAAIVFL